MRKGLHMDFPANSGRLEKMRYCKKCLNPSTKPGIVFDENGLCMACVYAGESASCEIDWKGRQKKLQEIVAWAKKNSHGRWDCAIGVSGGKDSHFQALYAKEELGLQALLVNCAPDQITDVGRHNLENLVQQGFDLVSWRPNPVVMRQLTKRAFYEYGNAVKPSEYPLFAVTYQTALAYTIPLIIQGENPGLTLGSAAEYGTDDDAFNIVMGNTVQGGKASDWIGEGVEAKDLILFQFPRKEEMKETGLRAIYLQYYVPQWSPEHNTEFAVKRGLQGRPDLPWRLNRYASVDGDIQLVNPVLKYYKLGYSNMTDAVGHRIRQGMMSRQEAIHLVKKWDGYCEEKYIKAFCDDIAISLDEFWRVVDRWVNRDLFFKDEQGRWTARFEVGVGLVK